MSITQEEANKCLKSLMRVLIVKGGDKYWMPLPKPPEGET